METLDLKSHTTITSGGEAKSGHTIQEHDNAHLQRMGKKPVLKRNFGLLSIFGFSCTILGTWEGLLGTFIRPLEKYTNVIEFAIRYNSNTIFVVLSELASMAPTAGGQYHWAAMLAPIRCQRFLSYITGWWAVLAIQGAAILGNSQYDSLPWQGTLLVWASLACALLANLAGGKVLPRIETITLIEEVFLQLTNNGGFKTQGLSWFVGMTSCAFSLAGGDAAVHMSEEVKNASRVVPKVIMLSVAINGCLGFGMLITVLFCVGKPGDALNSPTGYPFMEIFYEATNSLPGSLTMCSIVLVNYCCSLVGMLAAASRQLWSFSRDKGVPGWHWWSQVSSTRHLPIHSIILTVLISTLLALINIGSSVALDDVLSMAVSGSYLSYLMVSILLFYRRIRGEIFQFQDSENDVFNVPGAKLVWGPFYCPGTWGILVNALAIIYNIIVIFF
ncbi:amino acid permease [Penicillium frequentans]|nr:amino acid permease [Penicillium glabrum]